MNAVEMSTGQAIPATEFRRPSPVLALLWKEWRQQRPDFLALALAGPLIVLLGSMSQFISSLHLSSLADASWVASYFDAAGTLIATAAAPILLGANAFAGERDDHAVHFLRQIPVSSTAVFWGKLVVVSVLCSMCAALVFISSCSAGNDVWAVRSAILWMAVGVLAGLSLGATASMVAAAGAGVTGTTVGAVACGALAIVWRGFTCVFMDKVGVPGWSGFLQAGYGLALIVALAWWAWVFRRQCAGVRAKTVALCAGLAFLALAALPPVAVYCHAVLQAPSAFFTAESGDGPPEAGNDVETCAPSPSGAHVLLECRRTGWVHGTRAALINTGTGSCSWLDRIRVSRVKWGRATWSPDGGRYFVDVYGVTLWPIKRLNPLCPVLSHRVQTHTDCHTLQLSTWLVDARTGRRTLFSTGVFDRLGPRGWFDDTTVFVKSENTVLFVDVDTGAVKTCAAELQQGPMGLFDPPRRKGGWDWKVVPGVGVFGVRRAPDTAATLTVFRFHPERSKAERFTVEYEPEDWHLLSVSPDGRRLLFVEFRGTSRQRVHHLAALATGTVTELRPPPGLCESPHISRPEFLPDGRTAVSISRDGAVLLYDTGSGSWSRLCALSSTSSAQPRLWRWIMRSPNGRYGIAMVITPRLPGPDPPDFVVVDLQTGESWQVWHGEEWMTAVRWAGSDSLLVQMKDGLWIVNRDGSGKRRLLPKG